MEKNRSYDFMEFDPEIGQKSFGWVCVAHYQHHNSWQRMSKTAANGRKESFPKKAKPNQYAISFSE